MRKINHYLPILCAGILLFVFVLPNIAFATTQYVPLEPLPGTVTGNTTTPGDFFPGLFRLSIGIAAGLAVLAIAFNGLRYMMSDVVTSKSAAKTGIRNAVWGLVLALGAFVILQTINPDLVSFNFGVQQVSVTGSGTIYEQGGEWRSTDSIMSELQDKISSELAQIAENYEQVALLEREAQQLNFEAYNTQYDDAAGAEGKKATATFKQDLARKLRRYTDEWNNIIESEIQWNFNIRDNPSQVVYEEALKQADNIIEAMENLEDGVVTPDQKTALITRAGEMKSELQAIINSQ